MKIEFKAGKISTEIQDLISQGLVLHSRTRGAPPHSKKYYQWCAYDDSGAPQGAVAVDVLWDWMYISELWVSDKFRGQGLGRKLMHKAEEYAAELCLVGIWLWTQSWQAETFYKSLGYVEFARFPDLPRGFERIGFRKNVP